MSDAQRTEREEVSEPTGYTIAAEHLAIMNRLGEIGIGGIEGRLRKLSQYNGVIESEHVAHGFARPELMEVTFSDEVKVGARVNLPGAPYGYALVLFSPTSANNAARLMLQNVLDEGEQPDRDLALSALTELSAMMANGFLDAWSDTFDQEIDSGVPMQVRAEERELVERVLRQGDDLGLYVVSTFRLPTYDIRARVYLFPRNDIFVEILKRISVERVIP